jgi:hypothetical protein
MVINVYLQRMPTGAIEVSVTELEVVDPDEKIEPILPEPTVDLSVQIRAFSTSSNISIEETKLKSMYYLNIVKITLSSVHVHNHC